MTTETEDNPTNKFEVGDRVLSLYGHRFVVNKKMCNHLGWSYEDGSGLWIHENWLAPDNWLSRLDIWAYVQSDRLFKWIANQPENLGFLGFIRLMVFAIAYFVLLLVWIVIKFLEVPGKLWR